MSEARKSSKPFGGKPHRKKTRTIKARTVKQRLGITNPMPQIIGRIPQKGMSGNKWGAMISAFLKNIWLQGLSSADRKMVAGDKPLWLLPISSDALRVLDGITIRQAGTTGWRIGLSEIVRWRFSEWEMAPDGLGWFRQYHSAVERAVKIFQGKKKPPLDDPAFYGAKVETVKELRSILNEMRNINSKRPPKPISDEKRVLSKEFAAIVLKRPKSFPYLNSNLDR
jgi:hypothetical protein